ncbi:MAG TPA: OmpA family protein [Myxococcaceae bacterium]|nr:OmpA family protein [Myxococcaceae bacterium]
MTPMSKKLSWVAAVGLLASGCAETPKELIDARAAYKRVSTGPAAQTNPVQVAEARKSLDEAENACATCWADVVGRDKAYVALRTSERAEAMSRTALMGQELTSADAQLASLQSDAVAAGQAKLAAANAASAAALGTLGKTQAQLDADRAAAEAAQRKAQAALDKIRGKLTVTDRGTIITLPGALLFPTAKSSLSPGGRRNLVPLMDFLRTDGRKIVVEGYTDSTGSMDTNMKLSQARADTVMNDIIKDGGIPADRISAVGRGPENPIGDNATKAGRELNRRVEILLLNPPK